MSRSTLALATAAIAAAACSGGGSKEEKRLTTGTYAWRAVEATDGCQFLDDFGLVEDVEVAVVVGSASILVDSLALTRDSSDETRFSTTLVQTLDWRDDAVPYDCVEEDTYTVAGEITGVDEAHVDVTITFTAVTGTGCNLANAPVTLPCTSEGHARLERLQPGA